MNSVMVSLVAFVAGVKNRLAGEEKGATMVEYGLMVALIAVIVAAGASILGIGINELFVDVDGQLP